MRYFPNKLLLLLFIISLIFSNCKNKFSNFRNLPIDINLPAFVFPHNDNLILLVSLKQKPQYSNMQYCIGNKTSCDINNNSLWKNAETILSNNIVLLTKSLEHKDLITITIKAQNTQNSDIITRTLNIKKDIPLTSTNEDIQFSANCSTISERIFKKSIQITEPLSIGSTNIYYGKRTLSRDWYNFENLYPIITTTSSNAHFVIGWQDKNQKIHLQAFKYNLEPINNEIIVPSQRLRDLYIEDDGSISVVHFHSSRMHTTKYNPQGQQLWNTTFNISERSIPMHMGKIKKYNNYYAVYFGIQGMGGHQGDALQFLDPQTGNIINHNLSWTWGCSHSIDERLEIYQNTLVPVCLSDYYPSAVAHRINSRYGSKVIVPEVRHYNGIGSGNLGGMVIYKDHVVISMSSSYQRSSRDASLIAFSAQSPYTSKGRVWLTDTSAANEIKVKVARYGSKLLVMWTTTANPSAFTLKVIDLEFNSSGFSISVIKEEENIPLEIGEIEDLATTPKGDIIFAGQVPNNSNQLQIQFIKSCE